MKGLGCVCSSFFLTQSTNTIPNPLFWMQVANGDVQAGILMYFKSTYLN